MNKRMRIRNIINISTMVFIIVGVIALTSVLSKNIFISLNENMPDNNKYVLENIANNDIPVVKEVKNTTIIKPFISDSVNTEINYYDVNSDADLQERSLILFDKTYMPSTGIMYSSDNKFDVLSILDGEVTEVKDDDILTKVVTIKHSNNLISTYSSLSNILVNVGDHITQGSIIASSSTNKVLNKESLLLELTHDGKYVNPDNYYNQTLESMN